MKTMLKRFHKINKIWGQERTARLYYGVKVRKAKQCQMLRTKGRKAKEQVHVS